MEFSNLFLIQEYFYYTPSQICFVPTDHLSNCCCPEYISYLYIFFDFKSDMMRLCNEQTTVIYEYFPKKVPFCGKSDILIQF